jgi:protein AaeX
MMIEAWLVTSVLRRVAGRWGLLRYVWHPALFVFAVYIIVLSSFILAIAEVNLS